MKVLDLFSGIGGFSIGLERAGMETAAFCEADIHAQRVLKKHWPDVPVFDDVELLDGKQFRGAIDVICGGFPCQDLSNAGKGAGINGARSSLYREMLRIIGECLPKYAVFENVSALLSGDSGRWFAQFLYDLASIGYDAEWHCIPASAVGAPHHRDRVWIIAYPSGEDDRYGQPEPIEGQKQELGESAGGVEVSADANLQRCERRAKIAGYLKEQIESVRGAAAERGRFNLSQPPLCGADDGVSGRAHRLKQLGNAVVPDIPEAIGRAILMVEGAYGK